MNTESGENITKRPPLSEIGERLVESTISHEVISKISSVARVHLHVRSIVFNGSLQPEPLLLDSSGKSLHASYL